LLKSIVVKSGGLSASVGATAPYATALERGTARMAARPFLRRALSEALPEIRRILAARLSS
jgi:HK97 gp10 family phage protein